MKTMQSRIPFLSLVVFCLLVVLFIGTASATTYYDNFNGTSINATLWTNATTTGCNLSESGGFLKIIQPAGAQPCYVNATLFKQNNFTVEFNQSAVPSGWAYLITFWISATRYDFYSDLSNVNTLYNYTAGSGTSTGIRNESMSTYFFELTGSKLNISRNDSVIFSQTNSNTNFTQLILGNFDQTDGEAITTYYDYIEVPGAPSDIPTYSNIIHSQTVAGQETSFSADYNDTVALHDNGIWRFCTNNTGVWSCSDYVNFSMTPETIINVSILNSTVGVVVGYNFSAKNNAGFWTNTSIYTLTTISGLPRPNITSWSSDFNGTNLTFTVPKGTTVLFNVTTNQTLTGCSWGIANPINCSNNSYASFTFNTYGTQYVDFSGSNGNGTTSNSIVWTVTVPNPPPSTTTYNWTFPTDNQSWISAGTCSGTNCVVSSGWNSSSPTSIFFKHSQTTTADRTTQGARYSQNFTYSGGIPDIVFLNFSYRANMTGTSSSVTPYMLIRKPDGTITQLWSVSTITSNTAWVDVSVPIVTNNFTQNGSYQIRLNATLFGTNNPATATISWDNVSLNLTMIPEEVSPTYSGATHNQTVVGVSTNFSISYNDNLALQSSGQWMFSTNNTGTWVNSSLTNFTSTPQTIYNISVLNSTVGTIVGYRFYAHDNAGNWNNTSIYTLNTSAVVPYYTMSGVVNNTIGTLLASVLVSNVSGNTTTNATGYYTISNIVNGTYNFTYSKGGYISNYKNITITGANLTNQNITLTSISGYIYPIKNSSNNRYLVDQNNVPFMIVGESMQKLPVAFDATSISGLRSAQELLALRASQGINSIWVNALVRAGTGGDANGNTFDGIPPFDTTNDISTPNATYFARLDSLINISAENGIVVMLDPIETIDHLSVLQSNGLTKATNYGKWIGNRYKNYDNIIWLHGNDFMTWGTPSDDALVLAVANGIRNNDTNHIQTIMLDYDVSDSLEDPNWNSTNINLNLVYSYEPPYVRDYLAYNRTNYMPIFYGEGNYEEDALKGFTTTPYIIRKQAYWSMLSGAYGGHMYGHTWNWHNTEDWQNYKQAPGLLNFTIESRFFQNYTWYSLIPDENHTIVTSGYGTSSTNAATLNTNDYLTAAYSTNSTGSLMIAYIPTNRTFTVNMSKFNGTNVTGKWFDPTNSVYTTVSGSPFNNSGSRNFALPGNNNAGESDWILILNASIAASFAPPIPINLTPTQGNFWINYTWQAGSGNITDSYNVSVNGTWDNFTYTSSHNWSNGTVAPHAWRNISVYAFNNSGTGSLNLTAVSNNTQVANNNPVLASYLMVQNGSTIQFSNSSEQSKLSQTTQYIPVGNLSVVANIFGWYNVSFDVDQQYAINVSWKLYKNNISVGINHYSESPNYVHFYDNFNGFINSTDIFTVYGAGNGGSNYLYVKNFNISFDYVPVPTILSPVNNSAQTSRIVNITTNATIPMQFQVSQASDFSILLFNTTTANNYSGSLTLPTGLNYIRVRGNDAGNDSVTNWSNIIIIDTGVGKIWGYNGEAWGEFIDTNNYGTQSFTTQDRSSSNLAVGLVYDSFDDNFISNVWYQSNGVWTESDGYLESPTLANAQINQSYNQNNGEIIVDYNISQNGFGIMGRRSDINHYYVYSENGATNATELYLQNSGWTLLNSTSAPFNTERKWMRLVLNGTNITGMINNSYYTVFAINDILSSGHMGLRKGSTGGAVRVYSYRVVWLNTYWGNKTVYYNAGVNNVTNIIQINGTFPDGTNYTIFQGDANNISQPLTQIGGIYNNNTNISFTNLYQNTTIMLSLYGNNTVTPLVNQVKLYQETDPSIPEHPCFANNTWADACTENGIIYAISNASGIYNKTIIVAGNISISSVINLTRQDLNIVLTYANITLNSQGFLSTKNNSTITGGIIYLNQQTQEMTYPYDNTFYGVKYINVSNSSVKNVTIVGGDFGIRIMGDGYNNVISYNSLYNQRDRGIFFDGLTSYEVNYNSSICSNSRINNNYVKNTTGHRARAIEAMTISCMEIYNNSIEGDPSNYVINGTYFGIIASTGKNEPVNETGGGYILNPDAVGWGLSKNNSIHNNYINNTRKEAILCGQYVHNCTIYNNNVNNISNDFGIDIDGGRYSNVYNNTIFNSAGASLAIGGSSPSYNVSFYNNILLNGNLLLNTQRKAGYVQIENDSIGGADWVGGSPYSNISVQDNIMIMSNINSYINTSSWIRDNSSNISYISNNIYISTVTDGVTPVYRLSNETFNSSKEMKSSILINSSNISFTSRGDKYVYNISYNQDVWNISIFSSFGYLNITYQMNHSNNLYKFKVDGIVQESKESNVTGYVWFNYSGTWSHHIFEVVDAELPMSITSSSTTTGNFWINNTWVNPTDLDFDHIWFRYANGTTITEGNQTGTYLNLSYPPHYTQNISAQTVDTAGNINQTKVWFNATIQNNPITIQNVNSSYNLTAGQYLLIDANYTDLDGDTGTFADNASQWNIDSTTGIVNWTSISGSYNWQINVSDGYGSISMQNFSVSVVTQEQNFDNDTNTFWIRTDGNDICSGQNNMSYIVNNTDCAKNTIQAGVTLLTTSNKTLYVINGTYNENVIFSASGNSTNLIRVIGIRNPLLDGIDGSGNAFDLNLNSYIYIDGFNVTRYNVGVEATSNFAIDMYNLTVTNSTFSNITNTAINIYSGSAAQSNYNHSITNNIFNNIGDSGSANDCDNERVVSVNRNHNLLFSNNEIINSHGGVCGIDLYDSTISHNSFSDNPGRLISFNTWENINVNNNSMINNSERNIRFDHDGLNLIIENNYIKNGGWGIDIYDNNTFKLINNIIINSWVYTENDRNSTISNNIIDCQANNVDITNASGNPYYNENITINNNVFNNCGYVKLQGLTVNSTVKNNIFYNSPVEISASTSYIMSYNDLFNSPVTGGTSSNSITSDPLFANTSSGDFHLKSQYGRWNGTAWVNDTVTSPAIGAGDPTSDNSKSPWGGVIEMGAYGNTIYASMSSTNSYIPPNATSLSSTQGNFWINYTWQAGSGNITNSYNVSVNGTWDNFTYTSSHNWSNGTVAPHAWRNISVYAFNNSGTGSLNLTAVSNNTQVANNAPIQSSIGNKQVTVGNWLNFSLNATDADNDTLMYGTNASKGNLSGNNYSWLTDATGTYNWNFNASDGYGGLAQENITITVNLASPYITAYHNSMSGWNQTALNVNVNNNVTFNVTVNQSITNVSWKVNGGEVQNTSSLNFTKFFNSEGSQQNITAQAFNSTGNSNIIYTVVQTVTDYGYGTIWRSLSGTITPAGSSLVTNPNVGTTSGGYYEMNYNFENGSTYWINISKSEYYSNNTQITFDSNKVHDVDLQNYSTEQFVNRAQQWTII